MANDNKGLTPMMRQFFEMKAKHPEALLLFRCGDFYETYCEDAIEASRILGITLTRRNNGGSAGGAEMAERICDAVACHSWYLQQLCYFIWSFTVSEVTEDIYHLGLKQVLNINTPMFQNDTENLSSTQIEMLKAIANGEQHFSSQAVKQIYNLGNPNTIVKNRKTLQNKDIIEKQNDAFGFVDPIYRLWFKEEYCR